ncbi:MAG: DUF1800 domain-containing protein [Burkholderiales bacterium]|nr:DUF1800 domain-containing protein [Burkholderiales bacterium]
MGYDDARHLLARTGFGPTDAEVRRYAALTREQGVDLILRDVRSEAVTPPPAFATEDGPLRAPNAQDATVEERRAFRQQNIRQGLELRAWWVQEMLATPSPLTERMTLFWHNHFVSSQQKVRFARLMYAQNATLRAHALGSFAVLLHAASKEPAMLVYLDTAQSRRQQPNENFAREVMELFTLGEGHYSEADVKEAARAFTGWSIDRETGHYRFRPFLHDPGIKSVLGSTGKLDGDAVLDIILAKPQTSQFVTAKLWREFVSPTPDAGEVTRIAQVFRGRGYDIKAALRALLMSDAFWAADNRGTLVKSPVELVVGTVRQLEVTPPAAMPFAVAAAGMGQNLFSPPNVKGWPGGEAWINSDTLLARKQFVDRLARMDGAAPAMMAALPAEAPQAANDAGQARARRFMQAMDRGLRNLQFDAPLWVARRPGATPTEKMQSAQALLLPLEPVTAEAPRADSDVAEFVRTTLLDPAYQLK